MACGDFESTGEENPFYERFIARAGDSWSRNPRLPFEFWDYLDPGLRGPVGRIANLDPAGENHGERDSEALLVQSSQGWAVIIAQDIVLLNK